MRKKLYEEHALFETLDIDHYVADFDDYWSHNENLFHLDSVSCGYCKKCGAADCGRNSRFFLGFYFGTEEREALSSHVEWILNK